MTDQPISPAPTDPRQGKSIPSDPQHLQTAPELQRRYRFEHLILEIASEFAGTGSSQIGPVIHRALSSIGDFTEVDRAYIFQFKPGTDRMNNTHEWCAKGIEAQIHNLQDIRVEEELPWFAIQIQKRNTLVVPDVSTLPPEARLEKEHFENQDIQSLIVVPLETENGLQGFLGFDSVRTRRTWNADDQSILQFFAHTLSQVIERKQTEEALQEANTIINRSGIVVFNWINQEGWPVAFVTDNVRKILGYSAGDFTSGRISYASCIHPDDLQRVMGEVTLFSSEPDQTEFTHAPYRVVAKDGRIKIVSDWTYITRDGTGTILGYRGIIEDITVRRQIEEALSQERDKLKQALKKIQTLSGLLPICASCKKVRDDKGYWKQLDAYISEHTQADFSHSICPECARKLYPDLNIYSDSNDA